MANISQYLENILSAVLGEEVRGSIHDAIDAINTSTEQAIANQIIQLDTSLSVSGRGADAKAVGDALEAHDKRQIVEISFRAPNGRLWGDVADSSIQGVLETDVIDNADLIAIARHVENYPNIDVNNSSAYTNMRSADFNGDGHVNEDDYNLFSALYNYTAHSSTQRIARIKSCKFTYEKDRYDNLVVRTSDIKYEYAWMEYYFDSSSGGSGGSGGSGNGIRSIVQTGTSSADGGINTITCTLDDGTVSTFQIKNGSKGSTGADGVTPNLTIGTVTTLAAGSSATASITGTAASPKLNLGIPRGADGGSGSGGGSYTLPVATENQLGGVQPVTKTTAMTQAVGVDGSGRLYTEPAATSGSGGGVNYGVCSTAASTRAKTVECSGFMLATGAVIFVKFENAQSFAASTSSPVTLNVNDTGAKSVMLYGTTIAPAGAWVAGEAKCFVYDGTNWLMLGANIPDGNGVSY